MTSKYVSPPAERPLPPRIGVWQSYREQAGGDVNVRVWREREAIGYGPAMLCVEFRDVAGKIVKYDELLWKRDLDDWLVAEGHRAVPPSAEALRFSFRMRARFEPLWQAWGDGYFNAVLLKVLREGPFAADTRLRPVLAAIREYPPAPSEKLGLRMSDVESVFYASGSELANLRYSPEESDTIIVRALATYLDDRFHMSDRQQLFGEPGIVPSPKKIAALALAEALVHVLRSAAGKSPSAHFFGALQNIEYGDDASVEANWKIIDREVRNALPEGYRPTAVKDEIRARLEKALAAEEPEVVSEACKLLGITPGGDPETYRQTWGRFGS